jgi:hypothetical protein
MYKVVLVLGKTVKYHVPNKRLPSHFFWCPLATVGHFDKEGKKIGYN